MKKIAILFLLVLTGCDDAKSQLGNTFKELPATLSEKFSSDTQDVFYVQVIEFKRWLENNKSREIVSITSFAAARGSQHNPTDGFVIVCKKMDSESNRLSEVRKMISDLQAQEQKLMRVEKQ